MSFAVRHVQPACQRLDLSSFVQKLVHFSVLSMAVFLVPLAVVAGYLTRKTGSLLPAIALHAIHNAGVLLSSIIVE